MNCWSKKTILLIVFRSEYPLQEIIKELLHWVLEFLLIPLSEIPNLIKDELIDFKSEVFSINL